MIKRLAQDILYKFILKAKFLYEQRKLNIIYRNPNVTMEENVVIEEYFSANLPKDGYSIKLGKKVHFKKYCHVLLFPNAKLTIGANVFFNNYCSINCLEQITIGEHTMFGEGVKLYDHNHLITNTDQNITPSADKFTTGPITIGKNCWIGSNVTILKGVSIGDNVVIGANCLVFKSIGSNMIVKSKEEYIIESQPGIN